MHQNSKNIGMPLFGLASHLNNCLKIQITPTYIDAPSQQLYSMSVKHIPTDISFNAENNIKYQIVNYLSTHLIVSFKYNVIKLDFFTD